jgi:hypothetical protein
MFVDLLMVGPAHQNQVARAVPIFIGLMGVVSRATFVPGLYVANLTNDGIGQFIHQSLVATLEGAAIA